MKKRSALMSAAAVLSLSALLAGCSGGSLSAAGAVAHRAAPQVGGTFINALPVAWDPGFIPLMQSSAYTQAITGVQFLPMIAMQPDGLLGPIGGVVDKWTLSPDKKTYTFYINPKVRWSNGLHVTSKDVELGIDWQDSVSYNTTDQGTYGYMTQSIVGGTKPLPDGQTPSGFKALGPYKFQLTTIAADPAVLNSQLSQIVALPYYLMGSTPMSKWKAAPFNNLMTVGDGPWVMTKVVPGESVVMKANNYFAWGKPYIPTYEWEVVKPAIVPGDLAKGTVTAAGLDAKYVAGLKQYKNVSLNISTGYGYGYLSFRLNNAVYGKEFRNVAFRQAMQYAVNRPALIKAFDKGYGTPENGPLPNVSAWYDQSIKNMYQYNPKMANALLDKAGFKIGKDGWRTTPSGRKFQPTLTYYSGDQTAAQEMQAITTMFQAVHVNFKLLPPIDFNSILHQLDNDANGKQPIQGYLIGISFGGVPDPDPRGAWRTTDAFNQQGWDWTYPDQYTKLNDLLIKEQASVKAFNYTYRKNIIDQWQKLYMQRLPMGVFLDDGDAITAIQSNVKNVTINTLGWFTPWKMYFSK